MINALAGSQSVSEEEDTACDQGKKDMKNPTLSKECGNCGRGDRIRTCGLLVPNQTRYQAALHLDGANERTRTADLLITNQLLYQLSYIGAHKAQKGPMKRPFNAHRL